MGVGLSRRAIRQGTHRGGEWGSIGRAAAVVETNDVIAAARFGVGSIGAASARPLVRRQFFEELKRFVQLLLNLSNPSELKLLLFFDRNETRGQIADLRSRRRVPAITFDVLLASRVVAMA